MINYQPGVLVNTSRVTEISNLIGLASLLSQIVIAVTAILIALYTYRYSVRANLRSSIGQVGPVETENYRIQPSLLYVKWRPFWASKLGFLLNWDWLKRHTKIKYDIYEKTDSGISPILDDEFIDEADLDLFHQPTKVYDGQTNEDIRILGRQRTPTGLEINYDEIREKKLRAHVEDSLSIFDSKILDED